MLYVQASHEGKAARHPSSAQGIIVLKHPIKESNILALNLQPVKTKHAQQ